MEEVPADLQSVIGRETPWVDIVVDRVAVERFLLATGETDPASILDRPSPRWGKPIVPFGFLGAMRVEHHEVGIPEIGKMRYNAGNEYRWLVPIHLGESLQRKSKIVEIHQREGKRGPLIFFAVETTFRRPDGQVVAVGRHTNVRVM